MKSIPLTQGKFALVDDEDYRWLIRWKWHYNGGYAKRKIINRGVRREIGMHNEIMGNYYGEFLVDHKDRNGLNNQKQNLRRCTLSQNVGNREIKRGASGYIGVYERPRKGRGKRWMAKLMYEKKIVYRKFFSTAEEAARARDRAAKEYLGEFANLNFPEEN